MRFTVSGFTPRENHRVAVHSQKGADPKTGLLKVESETTRLALPSCFRQLFPRPGSRISFTCLVLAGSHAWSVCPLLSRAACSWSGAFLGVLFVLAPVSFLTFGKVNPSPPPADFFLGGGPSPTPPSFLSGPLLSPLTDFFFGWEVGRGGGVQNTTLGLPTTPTRSTTSSRTEQNLDLRETHIKSS